MLTAIFNIFVFPGLAFLGVLSLLAEYFDRKFHAMMQNRVGPPWFQPFADFIKLCAKEVIVPDKAQRFLFMFMPVVALAAAVTPIMYIPIWGTSALYSFNGDIIVVVYLLTLPTLAFFLGGWVSTSMYSLYGAMRTLTQLFSYEVPLLIAALSPAILAGTWSLSGIALFYSQHPMLVPVNIIGFVVACIALLGKLERVPFDIPDAETEIVGGTFTEYSGRLLAFFRMAVDIELVVGSALLAALFIPFGLTNHPALGFLFFLLKITGIIAVLCILRTILARIRIDQMVTFCWKWLAPAALVQLVLTFFIKRVWY